MSFWHWLSCIKHTVVFIKQLKYKNYSTVVTLLPRRQNVKKSHHETREHQQLNVGRHCFRHWCITSAQISKLQSKQRNRSSGGCNYQWMWPNANHVKPSLPVPEEVLTLAQEQMDEWPVLQSPAGSVHAVRICHPRWRTRSKSVCGDRVRAINMEQGLLHNQGNKSHSWTQNPKPTWNRRTKSYGHEPGTDSMRLQGTEKAPYGSGQTAILNMP